MLILASIGMYRCQAKYVHHKIQNESFQGSENKGARKEGISRDAMRNAAE